METKRMNHWGLAALLLSLCGVVHAQTYSRTEQIVYSNDLDIWVIGQVKSVTCTTSIPASGFCDGGTDSAMSETTYDPTTALPTQSKTFGKIQHTLAYNLTTGTQDGTIATVKDGNNNVTTLSLWERGVPGKVTYPATTDQPTPVFQQAEINPDGTIASITDENGAGFTTSYGYDAMGRLNLIDYPDGDTVNWTSTVRTFSFVAAAYGLPSHWRLWERTGNGYKVTHYDALWRPVVEDTYDAGNVAPTRSIVVKRYDAAGRLAFQSYPVASLTSYTDALKGVYTDYDALDRVIKVRQDWEGAGQLITTTEYLDGFKTRVTPPKGQGAGATYQTTTSYMAWDQPTTDFPVAITHPAGAFTDIVRDPFGKPTSITRRNAGSTLSTTRSYAYYPTGQELCRVDEPETGTSAMGYDGAGNLLWSASGYSTAATGCLTSAAVAARRADRTYDARSRLKTLSFPGGNGNQTWTYTPDSLPASVVANNLAPGQLATTTYAYNRRRLPEAETLQYGSVLTWPVDYAYNTNGHLSSQLWHGLNITYAPDALGRPTQAGTFASGVSYHPNGAIKQFTYGNGITHTLTQNVRQLPDTSCDSYGACGAASVLNDNYDYDQNGNVWAISDGRTGNQGDRDMVYDALDRLTSAVAPGMFGTATYTYDVLDNLTRTWVTGGSQPRNYYYCYDGAWRLDFVRSGSVCTGSTPGSPVMSLDYDLQGNLSARSVAAQSSQNRGFSFDYGNRLRSTTGAGASSYAYDGLGRRVWDATTANKYSQYLQNGQLSLTSDGRTGVVAEYIYLQGSLVAIRERNTATNVYTTKYQHTDALGSPVAETDGNRLELGRYEYEPYGKGGPADKPAFTGHVLDGATGLDYMQQRYYDPSIGRFLSVDPVTAYEDPVGAFNRYWYANNNPYLFRDPDGRSACAFFGICPLPDSMKDPKIVAADKIRGHDSRVLVGTVAVSSGAGAAAALAPGAVALSVRTVSTKTFRELVVCALSLGDCRGNKIDHSNVKQERQRVEDAEKVGEAATRKLEDQLTRTQNTIPKKSDGGKSDVKLDGFKGVFRVEGRIDSKRLDKELSK